MYVYIYIYILLNVSGPHKWPLDGELWCGPLTFNHFFPPILSNVSG